MFSSHVGKLQTVLFTDLIVLILTTSGAMFLLVVIAGLFGSTAAQTGCVCVTDSTLEADAQMYDLNVSGNTRKRSADRA